MTIESSFTREIGKKKKTELVNVSPESSLTQGDSDSESTSVSSSMQSSISSSATTSLDRYNVKEETQEKKTLIKSVSKKTFPKITRTGSLRSVKILRSKSKNKNKNKNKNKSYFKSKNSEISQESHVEKPTFSSILKDSKFPEHLKSQPGPLQPEEILPEAKICPYQHCSLHGHHHHEPPKKRFEYLKKRTPKNQKLIKSESQPMDNKNPMKKKKVNTKKASNDFDFSIEFCTKTRSEEPSSTHDDAEFADILFGVNSFQEKKDEIPVSENQDLNDVNEKNNEKSNGSTGFHMSMWSMIHQHMLSGLAAESGDPILQQVDQEKKSNNKDYDDADNQETEIRKMFAIKLVREAIEKILLPEVQDDQSTTSEVISEQGETPGDRKDEPPATEEEKPAKKTEKGTPNKWSYLKKVILLTRFVKELEKVKKFNPKNPTHLPVSPEPEPETVSLRRQMAGDRKHSDEWMLDYALQKVVGELAPTQKRKVALLVQAFETVAPGQESRSKEGESQRVGSEPKVKLQEGSEIEPVDEKNIKEPKLDLEKEKHIKMWHMIYQHVVTDIATKMGPDLLLDGEDEESLTSDAVKLIQESVNEISSQDTQSVDQRDDENNITRLQQQSSKNWSKLRKQILLKRSIKALEGFRKLNLRTRQQEMLKNDEENEKIKLRNQMMNEKKKAEEWMLDYAVQHIVTKLTPARKKRVSMLVEAFEAVVPFPEF